MTTSETPPIPKKSSIKAVLLDLSGTLHIEDEPTPGAVDALNLLRQQKDIKIKFVSNTTKESKHCLIGRLRQIGFDVEENEVFTSLSAARELMVRRHLRPFLMVDKRAVEDFTGISQDNPNAVVIGLAPDELNYENMNKAMRLLQTGGCSLIAIHKGRYYRRSDGLALGPGPFVTALEFATGQSSEVIGKPSEQFFRSSIESLGCELEQCVMVGDDVRDDIEGAQNVGMRGILVKTGKYRQGDENTIKVCPHLVVENFAEAVKAILSSL